MLQISQNSGFDCYICNKIGIVCYKKTCIMLCMVVSLLCNKKQIFTLKTQQNEINKHHSGDNFSNFQYYSSDSINFWKYAHLTF